MSAQETPMRFILELADIISRSKHIVIKGTKYRSQKRSSTQNPKFTDPIPKNHHDPQAGIMPKG
jgi:hypothetical protein